MPTIVSKRSGNNIEYVDVRYMPRHILDKKGNKYELVLYVDTHGKPTYKYSKMSWITRLFGN
jgi:hypothetical protein